MTRKSNEERLGLSPGAKGTADAPAAYAEQENHSSGLSYVAPTHLIELPSQGKYYPLDHPLHNIKEIEIKEMTAKEEDILTSQSFIKKGVVFDRLLTSLIIDRRVRLEDLLIGDKNALLIGARINGYGADYQVGVACEMCNSTEQVTFDLAACPHKPPLDLSTIEEPEYAEAISEGESPGIFYVLLPKSGVTLGIRLLTGKDEKRTTAAEEMRKKQKLPEASLTHHFKTIIVSANGSTEASDIRDFVEVMPALDSKFLRKAFLKITPNVEMRQEFVCENCDYEQEVEVPFTSTFFWPE